jgi:hypothetical protein
MTLTLNGEPADYSLEGERDLGAFLSSLDAWLERRGLVMNALRVDGREASGDISTHKNRALADIDSLEVGVEPLAPHRAAALSRAAGFLERAASLLHSGNYADAPGLLAEGRELAQSRSGFLDADELSLLEYGLSALSQPESGPAADRVAQGAASLAARAAELENPRACALDAADSFDSLRPRMADLAVLLQTGRGREAMRTVEAFADLFARSVRLIPALAAQGLSLGAADLGGLQPETLYANLNDCLTRLLSAFSSQDSVQAGDICEYEMLPLLDSLFGGLRARLGSEA